MRFRLYREYGALNSVPVFNAFEQGVKSLGHDVVNDNEDISVIWSVLWNGRMANNHRVYKTAIANNKPVIIIEVGNLKRNVTWRICLNHINSLGFFGNLTDLDQNRPDTLKLKLHPYKNNRRPEILIATQHEKSLQWEEMPPMKSWVELTVKKIRQYSSRHIVVRPHPRSSFSLNLPGVKLELPKKVPNTYDDFDIDYNFHCVINHNSGPAVQAAIFGVPILCDSSSLAGELSMTWNDLEEPMLPDREDWFLKLCHTEWTLEEISQGIPLSRILSNISK